MPTNHVVRQGESLESIAHDHGFFDFHTIYRDELNAPLRELRPDPNLLFPGDVVVIPDRQPRAEVASTERTHRFAVRGRRVLLRIFLRDELGKTMEGVPYDLEVDGRILAQGKPTGAGGLVEEQIAPGARRGTLTIPDQTWTFLMEEILERSFAKAARTFYGKLAHQMLRRKHPLMANMRAYDGHAARRRCGIKPGSGTVYTWRFVFDDRGMTMQWKMGDPWWSTCEQITDIGLGPVKEVSAKLVRVGPLAPR